MQKEAKEDSGTCISPTNFPLFLENFRGQQKRKLLKIQCRNDNIFQA
jgi:hypothetical protein